MMTLETPERGDRFPAIRQPITVGGIRLRNRMVMSPMTTYGLPDPDGTSNERHRRYYEERAKSGLGLIIVESAMVDISGKCWPNHLAVYDDRYVPDLAALAETVKHHGPAVMLQLHHGGRVAVEALSGRPPLAPSPLAAPGRETPVEMSHDDIHAMVEAFGQAARRAREAGFDGVELHMGTAYLLLSFISPAQNVRRDEYGGGFDGRMRFPLQIVERVRQLAGADFPIGARIVGSDYHDGGVDIEYCKKVASRLEGAGVAYLDVSAGVGPTAIRDSPLTMGGGMGVFSDFAAAVKSTVSVPVISVGRYYTMESAEAAVVDGKTDLVAFGRALIADANFVGKSLGGREADVIPCIGCQACHGGITTAMGVSCVLNPETGNEGELPSKPTAEPLRILVKGSGIAGLELARVAASRGHDVTVATDDLPFGGLLALRSRVPGAKEVGKGVRYFGHALSELGVRIVTRASSEEYDVRIDATPGAPIVPDIPGQLDMPVVPADDILMGDGRLADYGSQVVVIGPGVFAGETALFVASAGKEVTLLATGARPMEDAHPIIAGTTAQRFADHGGKLIPNVALRGAAGKRLELDVEGEQVVAGPFDLLVAAIGWDVPRPSPVAVHDTWDAFAQRLAVAQATRLGREL